LAVKRALSAEMSSEDLIVPLVVAGVEAEATRGGDGQRSCAELRTAPLTAGGDEPKRHHHVLERSKPAPETVTCVPPSRGPELGEATRAEKTWKPKPVRAKSTPLGETLTACSPEEADAGTGHTMLVAE
jgi:hypothetical protein